MVVKINSFGLMGMDSYPVEVEGAINKGFPACSAGCGRWD